MSETYYVITNIQNQIAEIEFFHEKGNSFPSEQLNSLITTFQQLGKDENIKVIILKSKGETVFCAGASFDELLSINDLETGKKFFMGFANLILTMKNCPQIIIGQIVGKVVGGGVGIISACDYTFAMDFSSIKLSELSIGIGPFVIEPAISKKIGTKNFAELTLNPTEWKSAAWCYEKGLFNEVFSNLNELETKSQKKAEELCKYSSEGMKLLKSIFWQNTEHWEKLMPERAAMSGELVLSDFTKQTLNKFKSN